MYDDRDVYFAVRFYHTYTREPGLLVGSYFLHTRVCKSTSKQGSYLKLSCGQDFDLAKLMGHTTGFGGGELHPALSAILNLNLTPHPLMRFLGVKQATSSAAWQEHGWGLKQPNKKGLSTCSNHQVGNLCNKHASMGRKQKLGKDLCLSN